MPGDAVGKANDTWSYERKRRCDKTRRRWHFVTHSTFDPAIPHEDQPYELYFRDDDRSEFGVLLFARRKDNPYRDHEAPVAKIMNNPDFRRTLLVPGSAGVWRESWR